MNAEADRRSGQDRRSNWIEALVRLRLPDSYLMALAEDAIDLITDGREEGQGRETAREALLDVLYQVRTKVEGGGP